MESLRSTKQKLSTKKGRANVGFAVRQMLGQAVLAAGTIAFVADNLDKLTREYALAIGAGVVLLVLYFANKR